MRIIRRYTNRKLYDTEQSCYVSLPDIAKLTREGVDVKVIRHDTGEDMTTVILSEVLYYEAKRGQQTSVVGLRRIIVSGLPMG